MPRVPAGVILLALALFSAAAPLRGQPAATAPLTAPSPLLDWKEKVLRMSDFLDTMLPGTLAHETIVVEFAPKFSDLRDYEFIRYPITLRYGLGSRWELRAGLTPFSPSPFNSGVDHRWGLGEGRLGVLYDIREIPLIFDDATIGVEARFPFGNPPIQLNDHYTHLKPGFSGARSLPIPYLSLIFAASYDRQYGSEAPPIGVIRRNVTEFAPGLLYKPGEFGLVFDYRYRIFDEPVGTHNGREYKAGPIWDIPLKRTAEWGLPGKWQLDLAYRHTTEEGRPDSNGVTARVHWKTTLKEMLKQGP